MVQCKGEIKGDVEGRQRSVIDGYDTMLKHRYGIEGKEEEGG